MTDNTDAPNLADLRREMQDQRRELHEHIEHCEARLQRGDEQFGQILQCLTDNTAAIQSLDRNTRGVVQAYQDVQATARVGNTVLRVAVWCIKAGGVLAVIGYGIHAAIEHFGNNAPGN